MSDGMQTEDRDGFIEPTPIPTGQEADEHHIRGDRVHPEQPAEGPDFEEQPVEETTGDEDLVD